MNAGVDADRNDALDAVWSAFRSASDKREEDLLRGVWRAYLDGKSKAQSGQKSSSGVGEHIHWTIYGRDKSQLSHSKWCGEFCLFNYLVCESE